jgi:hypothetical protein
MKNLYANLKQWLSNLIEQIKGELELKFSAIFDLDFVKLWNQFNSYSYAEL